MMAPSRSKLGAATGLALALLVAVWPVLCCCSFVSVARGDGTPPTCCADRSGAGDAARHRGADDASNVGGQSSGCHGGETDGNQGGGCDCQQSATAFAGVDAQHTSVAPPAAFAAFLPATGVNLPTTLGLADGTLRVRRPPPPALSRLRVLRI